MHNLNNLPERNAACYCTPSIANYAHVHARTRQHARTHTHAHTNTLPIWVARVLLDYRLPFSDQGWLRPTRKFDSRLLYFKLPPYGEWRQGQGYKGQGQGQG